ncbi:hypothetical protein F9B85_06955 [Heliorestis acidaminivorans]|uniref:Uncharacterized protein n=1 Tax=Heliorestis acidaminivorans TaxID=553427 RepID=A0A6I0F328_9FIRM|nr:hypothetical protein [Heliorestis acidaminivorans]KAB2952996.1 hypothetical protein F9B85_06955 [Heliorestis acidaminivorans]
MAGLLSRLFGKKEEQPPVVPQVTSLGGKNTNASLDVVKGQENRWNITSLTNALPHYELEKVAIIHSNRDFYVDLPLELKPFMLQKNKNFVFHEDKSFDGFGYYSDIPMRTGIMELVELLNKHRLIAAKEWLEEATGTFENETKWGVLHINPYGKTGRIGEENALEVQVYKTDEFTHRVFRSIYRELKSNNHEISKIGLNEVNRYNCFLTEFRLYGVFLNEKGTEQEVILQNDGKASVQALEESSLEDRKFSLQKWFASTTARDAGSNDKAWSSLKYYDLFIDKEDLTIGFTASATLQGASAVTSMAIGKSKVVPLTKQGLSSLMSEGIDRSTAYQLSMLGARNEIVIT